MTKSQLTVRPPIYRCSLHSDCDTCPFPDCIAPDADMAKKNGVSVISDRDREIQRLHLQGIGIKRIGKQYGISKTRVYAILARCGRR